MYIFLLVFSRVGDFLVLMLRYEGLDPTLEPGDNGILEPVDPAPSTETSDRMVPNQKGSLPMSVADLGVWGNPRKFHGNLGRGEILLHLARWDL